MRDVPPGWRWGDPLPPRPSGESGVRVQAPQRPAPGTRPKRRQIYGYIYELFTGDLQDGPDPYVGQTTTSVPQRIRGHKSAASIAKDPWKARILPGRDGYRILERVYATGDPVADQKQLDRAESFWIDRINPTHNDVRPAGYRPGEGPPPRPADSPRRGQSPRTTRPAGRPRRKARRIPGRALAFLLLAALFTALAARGVLLMNLAWPAVPWIVSPVAGVGLAWPTFMRLHKAGRFLKLWR